ncbi:MAG TPA: hypothetical protein VMH00_03115 [Candidatus Limnocylindrales bacterium]|nr:hypothetical protein [Candidatus Limnocylindrales bacterium]
MGIIVPLMFVISVTFLLYIRTVEVETVSPKLRKFAIPAAKYVAATFIGTFGAFAIGVVIAAPLLLYSHVAHTTSGIDLASSLVDRPYFPLPMAVAFGLGYFLSEWLKEGLPVYVWVWPVAQVSTAVLLFHPSPMQSFTAGVWRAYFDWGCGCSVTLLQWRTTWPLYPALSFSAAAFFRGHQGIERRVRPGSVSPS